MRSRFNRNLVATILILGLVLVLALVACRQDEPTPTPEPQPTEAPAEPAAEPTAEPTAKPVEVSEPLQPFDDVSDRLWVLVAYGDVLNPTVVSEGTVITASFSSADEAVSGRSGCNNYFAGYTAADGGSLTIDGPIGMTMMACETGMEAEAAYLAALDTVTSWALSEEGRLELTYSTGQPFDEKLVFTPGEVPLTDTIWRLVTWGNPDEPTAVEDGTSVTAVFVAESETAGTVGGNATCNSYTASYTLDGSDITFGPIAGTLMLCPFGAEQEAAYLEALGTAQSFEIIGPNLQITYDGGVLNYTSLNLPLENVVWQAVAVSGEAVPEGVEITALFDPGEEAGIGTVGGSSGCNNYSGSYEVSGESLTIAGSIAVTLRLCPDEALNQLGQNYLSALQAAETYEILGDQLVIHSGIGDIQYTADRQPLLGTLWTLASIGDVSDPQPPVDGSSFTAQFSRLPTLPSGTVVGETGCNQYNATFTANLSEIKVNLPVTTRVFCSDALQEAEQQFFLTLNAATQYRILGNVLQIADGNGLVMNFMATQPPVPPVEEPALDLSSLDNTFWYLQSIGDNALLPFTEITAGFAIDEGGTTGTISGSGGCNAYNAAIGENFAVGPIASTQRACPQEVMDQEGGYFDWLSQAYDYTRAGDQLLISTANGVLTFNSTPVKDQTRQLQNITWHLVSVGTLTTVPGSNTTTIFNADGRTISGTSGCNSFTGSYRTQPGNLLAISGVSSTLSACPTEELRRQEEALLIFLPSAVGYVVYGTSMQIQTVDGSVINYTSIPPAQPIGPTAVINGPARVEAGQAVTFDGSGSTAGSTPIVRYEWEMGDGTFRSGAVVQHAFNGAGTFAVRLTVVDQAGQSNTATLNVQATQPAAVPPTAVIEGPQMAFVGEQVTFSAANSSQGTVAISGYIWDSGDGNSTGQVTSNSFTTIYVRPGTYFASVTVVDANGLNDTASLAITINATLEGTDWILEGTIPGTTISLVFENGTLGGFAGCNSYNASYSTTLMAGPTNNITVGPIVSTGALCSPEISDQEQAYLADLQAVASYTISGGSLTLTMANGSQLVYFAAVATPF